MKHDFEDIEVKSNAPELLEAALKSRRKKSMIGTGAMCDPYMHCETELRHTRKYLEIIDKYGFGVAIQSKSSSILRDLDLLISINEKAKCVVQMTLTTFDEDLCKILEPNVSTTKERFETLKILRDNSYEVTSDNNTALMKIFYSECKNHEIVCNNDEIFKYLNTYEDKTQLEQLSLFKYQPRV